MPRNEHPRSPLLLRTVAQVVLVLAVCVPIYWINLGASGFSATEGHRAIPGWEMLERGDATVTRLFERPYLRKPPGMPWAVAASSAALGKTEFAARAVSATAATLSALVVLAFARRWFGPVGGLAAGLTQVLSPRWWGPGRSAEIESLHALGCMLAVLALADLLIARARQRWAQSAILGIGIVIAGLTKGPAGIPVVLGVAGGAVIVRRSWTVLRDPPALAGLIGGIGVVAGVLAYLMWRVGSLDDAPVTQNVTEFLWTKGRAWDTVATPFVALGSAMPGALALLFPWGPDARAEGAADRPPEHARAYHLAQTLSWGCLLGLAILLVLGVSNPRYAMPVLTPIAPVVGYVASGTTGWFTPLRARIAMWMALGWRWAWPLALAAIGGWYAFSSETQREISSGRSAGRALAASLPDGCQLWADAMVEARPEVVRAAVDAARARGRSVRARWIPLNAPPSLDGPDATGPVFVLLRDDALGNEVEQARAQGWADRLLEISRGRVYKYSFRLYEWDSSLKSEAEDRK